MIEKNEVKEQISSKTVLESMGRSFMAHVKSTRGYWDQQLRKTVGREANRLLRKQPRG